MVLGTDPVVEAILRGDTHIETAGRPLAHVILGFPTRQYFIDKVKEPFRKCVELYAKRYPDPDKHPCEGKWDSVFRGILDKLVVSVNYRHNFFSAVRRIILGEIEHDSLYRDPLLAMGEWFIESVLDGKIEPREENTPNPKYWNEPLPYGGEHSIIYKLRQHRQEINRMIGRESK